MVCGDAFYSFGRCNELIGMSIGIVVRAAFIDILCSEVYRLWMAVLFVSNFFPYCASGFVFVAVYGMGLCMAGKCSM